MVITFNTGLGSTQGVFPSNSETSFSLFLITLWMLNDFALKKNVSLPNWNCRGFGFAPASCTRQNPVKPFVKEITNYSLYGSSGKVGMICKLILTDSSVYYAVTLVSSDAVWLLSHLTVKKGSWVRGMDCAVSALVTQIVQTLQRNECIFKWLHGGNVNNPFPLGRRAKRKRKWLIGRTIPHYRVLCVSGSKGHIKSLCLTRKSPRWVFAHRPTVGYIHTRKSQSYVSLRKQVRGEPETCWKHKQAISVLATQVVVLMSGNITKWC